MREVSPDFFQGAAHFQMDTERQDMREHWLHGSGRKNEDANDYWKNAAKRAVGSRTVARRVSQLIVQRQLTLKDCLIWCRERDSNSHGITTGGF
ncbi:MAG: hypothetical protein LM550_02865 [Candidatus Contendobacter sp.]|nr:hypothetical protein [Gammaproteobacteria bacterium]MCC8992634.1 hypothetical protein [Candidatus Contendobacter sp.]